MSSLRTYTLIGFLTLSMLFLAACGTSTNYSSSSAAPAPTATPTTSTDQSTGNSSYGSRTSATTTSTNTTPSAAVKTTTATVSGKTETVLATAQGLTLYYFTPDTATTTACTGGCASTWPPLLATGSNNPTTVAGIVGKLTVVSDANGQQVQYNGHFLYTYSGDSASGQANGQGLGGKWFVATAGLS